MKIMKKTTVYTLSFLLFFFTCIDGFSQSKKKLRKQIQELTEKINNSSEENETLKTKLNRISNIEIDDVITPEEQPKDVIVGESGWRVELNGNKYKSDLIGQLGTVWILDTNSQLQPQGAISLSEYGIDPNLINEEKDVIYKKFISKGTNLEGSGNASFVSLQASISNDQFSQFTINIDGTSLIKPKLSDLKKIAKEASDLFSNANNGVYICTGMHVVRYHSRIFSKSEGNAKIASPVVNIGGNFYGESNEELTDYLVIRQLTQLNKPSNNSSEITTLQLKNITSNNSSDTQLKLKASKLSPEELLTYFLKRQPTIDEILKYQSSPEEFLEKSGNFNNLNSKEKMLLKFNSEKLKRLPNEIKSMGINK
jgi:hypothetical protein